MDSAIAGIPFSFETVQAARFQWSWFAHDGFSLHPHSDLVMLHLLHLESFCTQKRDCSLLSLTIFKKLTNISKASLSFDLQRKREQLLDNPQDNNLQR